MTIKVDKGEDAFVNQVMLGVTPDGEQQKPTSFWILCEYGGYPVSSAYVCHRCTEPSAEPTSVCPHCGAEMSNMVLRSLWVDFNE